MIFSKTNARTNYKSAVNTSISIFLGGRYTTGGDAAEVLGPPVGVRGDFRFYFLYDNVSGAFDRGSRT